ncbi:hypothetical protein [Pedobacter frigiditerrae]|nr:hypothetical protein [Pedobacter frigiditerrae]
MKPSTNKVPRLNELRKLLCLSNHIGVKYVADYEKFIFLVKLYPKIGAVPTKYIDIVWHFHIEKKELYAKDCLEIFGYIISHKEAKDVISRNILEHRYNLTRTAWYRLYQKRKWKVSEMAVCGVDGDNGDYGNDDSERNNVKPYI